jgi:hypothetical protein
MSRFTERTAPLIIVVVGALTLGSAGTAVASHLIKSKDIKDHTILKRDLATKTVNSLAPPDAWYGAHMAVLNETPGTEGLGSPIGWSESESSSTAFVRVLAPPRATHLTNLAVFLQNAPGSESTRTFYIVTNDGKSAPCTMTENTPGCSAPQDMVIAPFTSIWIESDVSGGEAQGTDAAISWSASG